MVETALIKALEELPADTTRRIRTALAYNGLTQREFAKALGADEGKVSGLITGYRPWPEHDKVKAAEILGVPENVLFPEAA